MDNFEQKIAYEIGMKLAYQDYMQKTAYFGTLKSLYGLGKWGLGFGKGTGALGRANKVIGSAVGFGAMNTIGTVGFDPRKWVTEEGARAFTGGALGGLAFSAAMPLAGKLLSPIGKLGGKTFSQTYKGSDKATKMLAGKIDNRKIRIQDIEKQLRQNPANSKALEATLKRQKELLKKNKDLYKNFMKTRNDTTAFQNAVAGFQRSNVMPITGKVLGVGAGFGVGMGASGVIQGHHDAKIRSPIAQQNNVFNPVS